MSTADPYRGLRDSDGEPDAYEIVEEFWPYDGPYNAERTASAATMIARTVRYLNNATQKRSAVPYINTVGRVLSEIGSAVFALEQFTRQCAALAERAAADPTLYDDRYDRPGRDTAMDLAAELGYARDAIADLAARLQRAAAIASHLGNRDPS